MKRLVAIVGTLSVLSMLPAVAARAGESPSVDALLRLLVAKGVVSEAEAEALQAEVESSEDTLAEAPVAAAETAPETPRLELPKALKGLRLGLLAYLSYQDGERYQGVAGETTPYSRFTIKRGYLNVTKKITPYLSARVTPDVHQDADGDWKLRLKYLYAKLSLPDLGLLREPYLEVGLAHMPWLDFEEHVNRFRMQDTMFMERNHLFNSADAGMMFGANLGHELPEDYRKGVNDHYAGRYGSLQVGVYNGGGYHATEKNTNKVVEGRLSLRPMPDRLPGFQVSLFGLSGRGNAAAEPDWDVVAAMLSYESRRLVATAQMVEATGNQKGDALRADSSSRDQDGYSFFAEVRLDERRRFSLLGRYDRFDTDSDDPDADVKERLVGGVAWQFAKGNYWVLDLDRLERSAPGIPSEDRVQLTLQLKY